MAGRGDLLKPVLWALPAGAVLAFTVFWFLQAIGPSRWEEATTVSLESYAVDAEVRNHHLFLDTASGDRIEARGTDPDLDIQPGERVRVEVSEVGREVQAVELHGHRADAGASGDLAFCGALIGGGLLAAALAGAAEARDPLPAALIAIAGLGVGALPVLLLF
ncbi:hypothetical protein [Amycolatopsis sp. cmx-4-68]|uniref:hypothetical protein n=1 Tax=Amycolatopsis sp. cmx-4-68 TaxID=2790938 RepID=UPI00397E658B